MKLYNKSRKYTVNRSFKYIFLLCFLCGSFLVKAQNQPITLAGDITLREAFIEIEKQTNLSVDYNDQLINANIRVKKAYRSTKLADVLHSILGDINCSYVIQGSHILITPKEPLQTKSRVISGTVVDEKGEPIIGANIVEKGTTNGMITDIDGNFSLSVSDNATLQISYIGYMPQEVVTRNKTTIQIVLREDSQTLDEVVVIGYGTIKKKDLSGAIASVKGETLVNRKTLQLSSALQGTIGGLMVTRNGNDPSSTATLRVRGVTTIGDSSPLVIIDGVPGDINRVPPNDVESISVLKDAASASIYGSRAASGVILVTTKRASENDLSLSYNFEYGWEKPTNIVKLVNAQRYIEMRNEMKYNDNPKGGWFQAYTEDQVNNWMNNHQTDPDRYPDTNWEDWLLEDSAPRQSHIINIAGGSKNTRTKASFTYDKVDGLYANKNYDRFMIRVNNDFKFNQYFAATLDFNFNRSKSVTPHLNPYSSLYYTPVNPAVFSDGRYGIGSIGNANPYAKLMAGGDKTTWGNQIGGKASLDFTPFEGFKISGIIAPTYNFDKVKSFKYAIPYSYLDDPNTTVGYFSGFETTKLAETRNDYYNYIVQFIATYEKTFGRHHINVMGGYENYYSFWEGLGASRDNYQLTNFPYLDAGPEILRDNSGSAYEYAYRSWLGRGMYSYANKYLFQFNIRHDGSSRFRSNNRWGTFPSFSAGWVLSEEQFMKNLNAEWLSFLKARGSWGMLGNERIGNYPSSGIITFFNTLLYQSGSATPVLTAAQTQYVIDNISWEKTESFNIGIDATLFDNRLRFTGDYYKKKTKDMLLSLEIPGYVGYDNPSQNAGRMETKGWEIDLTWNDRIGDWHYGASFNLSDFVSKMGNLNGTEFLGEKIKKQGSQFDEWYGYLTDGMFLTQEDVDNSPKLNNNIQVGDVKYLDVSGPDGVPDGKISPEYDRVLLGGSLPRFMFGGTMNVGYKGFDLALAFQGVADQKVKRPIPTYGNWDNNFSAMLDGNHWSAKKTDEENTKVKYPRLTEANMSSNSGMSDLWMFNGRYFRLKNLTLGYTLPSALTQHIYMKDVRFYVSANDLFCINKYPKGYDPEASGSYPITTSVIVGFSVTF